MKAESAPATAKGLLVDFEKAYDSVSRPYILWVLEGLGFPPRFSAMVATLHEDTSCRFLVNGYESRQERISTGIRQGCPLAPLLFVISLNPLYTRVESDSALRGIQLSTATW